LPGVYASAGEGDIVVRGQTSTGPFERRIHVVLPLEQPEHDVLAPLWARARIDAPMDQDWLGVQRNQPDPKIKDAVTKLGMDFGLMTQYTSFVAVEEKVVNKDGRQQTVQVPVEMTDGVSYEGVFGAQNGPMLGAPGAPGAAPLAKSLAMPPQSLSYDSVRRESTGALYGAPALKLTEPAPAKERNKAAKPQEPVDPAVLAKIDPLLQGLSAKLVNGNYREGPVNVRNGVVEVFIRLSDDSPDRIKELEKLGANVKSHTASGRIVFAEVRVTDLDKIAALKFVTRIEPPKY